MRTQERFDAKTRNLVPAPLRVPVPQGTEAVGEPTATFLGEHLQSAECVCSGISQRQTRERDVSCIWHPGKITHQLELTQPYRIVNRKAYARAKGGSAGAKTGMLAGLSAALGTGVVSGLVARYLFKVRNPAASVLGLALGAAVGVATGIFSGRWAKRSAYQSAMDDPETGAARLTLNKTVGLFDENPPVFSRCFNLGLPTN